MVDLAGLLSFWKKKEVPGAPAERVIPLPQMAAPIIEAPRSTSVEEVNKARESLKVLRLEKQILGSALTTIYESQTKGVITQTERDRLLGKYKADLTNLEKGIEENQRLVDLFDLENAREELQRNFKAKLLEIDTQIKSLKSGGPVRPTRPVQPSTSKGEHPDEKKTPNVNEQERQERQTEKPKEKKPAEDKEQEISEAEKRVNQIREEILKAMDRLEQIEAEG